MSKKKVTKTAFAPLAKAVELLGGQSAVARLCAEATGQGIKQQHVYNWLYRDHAVPADCAAVIATKAATLGKIVDREGLAPSFAWHVLEDY